MNRQDTKRTNGLCANSQLAVVGLWEIGCWLLAIGLLSALPLIGCATTGNSHLDYTALVSRAKSGLDPDTARLLSVQQDVWRDPQNTQLCQKLLDLSYDAKTDSFTAVGIGLEQAGRPLGQARALAERAATVDAQRWLMILRDWRQRGIQHGFGSVSGTISGAEIVSKTQPQAGMIVVVMRAAGL